MNLGLKNYILGGLASGLVVFLGGIFLAGVLLAGKFPLPDVPTGMEGSAFALHTVIRFLVGFGAFTVYVLAVCAQIPRISPLTLSILLVWLVVYTPGLVILMDYSGISFTSVMIAQAWGLIEVALAIAAGKWAARV